MYFVLALQSKARCKTSLIQNMSALINRHKSHFTKSNTDQRKRSRSVTSPNKSPCKSPDKKRSNSEERIQRLKEMQKAPGVEELFEHMKQLEIERQLEREDMQRERERFFKQQEELIAQQRAIISHHQEEKESWRKIQGQLTSVLGTYCLLPFKAFQNFCALLIGFTSLELWVNNPRSSSDQGQRNETFGLWGQPTPNRRLGCKTPVSRNSSRSSSTLHDSELEVEVEGDLSQEGGEFRVGSLFEVLWRLFPTGFPFTYLMLIPDGSWCP